METRLSSLRLVLLLVTTFIYSPVVDAEWSNLPIGETRFSVEYRNCPIIDDIKVGYRVTTKYPSNVEDIPPVKLVFDNETYGLMNQLDCPRNYGLYPWDTDKLLVMWDLNAIQSYNAVCTNDTADITPTNFGIVRPVDSVKLNQLIGTSGNGIWSLDNGLPTDGGDWGWQLYLTCSTPPEIISCDSFESCPTP